MAVEKRGFLGQFCRCDGCWIYRISEHVFCGRMIFIQNMDSVLIVFG